MSEAGSSADARPPQQPVFEGARLHARDRYLAALLAPAAAQADLVVLAAYLGEISRIPLVAHDAAIGEIRLAWWRDALSAPAQASGHPVADALRELQGRRSLSLDLLLAPIEGFGRELYEDGVADARELMLYANETEGAAIRLALAILGGGKDLDAEHLVEPAARALALTRLALTLPQHLSLGRLPLPVEFLGPARDPRGASAGEAREAVRMLLTRLSNDASGALSQFRSGQARLSSGLLPAFLPACLVEPYFKSMLAPRRDALVEIADISPLTRVVRMWFAHWRRRI